MKNKLAVFFLVSILYSCGATKSAVVINDKDIQVDKIIRVANSFTGTRYKFGGTTKKGMDCSGLVFTAFKSQKITLPRVSRDMALQGITVPKQRLRKGDLVFFSTGRKYRINHVGLVTKIVNNEVFFIHASSSRGVVTSSLNEKYYKSRFVKAKRIL